jgi:hypothetical protein
VEIERGRELLRAEGFGLAALADSETRLEAAGVLDISGELDHQACDDAVCFPPQTVPLRWSVKTTGLER